VEAFAELIRIRWVVLHEGQNAVPTRQAGGSGVQTLINFLWVKWL
jgi:hypothetical protein